MRPDQEQRADGGRGPLRPSPALALMLGPEQGARFFRQYWESAPLVVRGGLPSELTSRLARAAVAHLAAPGSAESSSVVRQGVARPVGRGDGADARFRAYAEGCTLLAIGLERFSALVAEICRDLDLEVLSLGVPLAAAVSANAYLTPAGTQAFDLHYDDHCAFVLQLRGTKDWQVFAPVTELPLDRCEQPVRRDRVSAPAVDTALRTGDVLYLPRGWPHAARSPDAGSLHLTLSLRTVTWAEAIGDLCRRRPALRRSIPPVEAGDGAADEPAARIVAAQIEHLHLGDFRQRRVADGLSRLGPLPTDRFAAIDAAAGADLGTTLRRAPRMTCLSTTDGDEAVLSFPGSRVRLPAVMREVCDFLAGTPCFRAGDLPAVGADYDRIGLVRDLVARGLLVPSTGAGPEPRAPAPGPPASPPAGPAPPGPAGTAPVASPRTVPDLTLVRPGGPVAGRHLDWLVARRTLTGTECDAVIAACGAFPEGAPTIVDQDRYPDRRRVLTRQIGLTGSTRWFLELIRDLAAEASRSHYGLSLTGITRPPQYLEYRPGQGHFHRHNDYSHDQADSPRKLTVIFQLSAPADYEGGRLTVHGLEPDELPTARGSVVVFPSFLYHSVSPVTRGVRRALVAWVAGPRLR